MVQYNGQVCLAVLVVMAAFALQHASAGSAGYKYAYGVNDPYTGDIKDQQETRDGDQVSGYYRLMDADGMLRTVNYRADGRTGFRAVVNREPATPGMVFAQQPDGVMSDGGQRMVDDVLYNSAPAKRYAV